MSRTAKLILILLLICIPFLGACDKSGIDFNVGYNAEGGFGSFCRGDNFDMGVVEMVDTREALLRLCTLWSNDAFNENGADYSSAACIKLREYDQAFFDNSNLIFCSSLWGSPGCYPVIKGVSIEDSILKVSFSYKRERGAFNDIATNRLILIEVSKNDILSDIQTVELVEVAK